MSQDPVGHLFEISPPQGQPAPMLISVPHAGTAFPATLKQTIKPEYVKHPPDTDWWVHILYDFAPQLGVTLIKANYSRYVIDLNRNPEGVGLYSDGRPETGLVPTCTFSGARLYRDGADKDCLSQQKRLEGYYWPYYSAVAERLKELRRVFPKVLLFDAHSIKRHIPRIKKDPFPDLILGNRDGVTCSAAVLEAAFESLSRDTGYRVSRNDPFRGGQITQYFADASAGILTLQLEMSQDIYMDEEQGTLVPEKQEKLVRALKAMVSKIITVLQ